MISRSLTVLMWKLGVVRIRRFIHTVVDIVFPILLFGLLFMFKDNINPRPPSGFSDPVDEIQHTDVIPLRDLLGPERIYYYPDTPHSYALMEAVGDQLYMKKLTHAPDSSSSGYIALSNESIVKRWNARLGLNDAVVIFQDMEGEEMPKKLNYTIRMNKYFHTSSYQPDSDLLGTHSQFGSMYQRFMRLQWAIDMSYLKVVTGNDVPLEVSLREFPYYRAGRNEVIQFVCLCLRALCWMSLMITFVFLMSRLLAERTTGIEELIKMVGVSVHTLGLSHFLNVVPVGLVFGGVGAALLTVTSNPLIPKSSPALIFLCLFLYFVSVVAMAFACGYLTKSTQYAVTVSVFVYIALWMPMRLLQDRTNIPRALLTLTGILPHIPMYWFWVEVANLEQFGSGVNSKTMWTHHSNASCSVFLSFMFLIVQSAMFFFLAWYLSLVRPGKYGQALPWNFLWKRTYWNKNEIKPQIHIDEEEYIAKDPKYFESAPVNTEVGIRIANVTKVYPKHVALKNVSLDVYKGEITVLLGHNGAGKTTLMSIITGMTSATEGKIYVNGKDTEIQLSEVRQHLGLCPQHNLYFPDLTVLQHVMFFTMLKRGTYREAVESSLKLVKQLGIGDKAGVLCSVLSGGMKRRLQLACALAGGADLLILDEPTSGLDVETRRELWDLLLSLRGSRTLLLSTHFMEEADALGDRVAALHSGHLRCTATTMHLKKAMGTGYRLTFTTNGMPDEASITKVVTSHVKDAKIKEKSINSLSYNLPAAASGEFPNMFTALESKRAELDIATIGVGVSTLEEVFLKLCSDVDASLTEDEVDTTVVEPTYELLTGPQLYFHQLFVLLKRQILYVLHRKWSFFALQVIFPVASIFIMTTVSNTENIPNDNENPSATVDMSVYRDMPDARLLYHVDSPALRTVSELYPAVQFQPVDNITQAILEAGKRSIFEYTKYIAGIGLNDSNSEVLFTTTVRHAAPVALSLLSNMIAAQLLPWADGHTFTTVNHPLVDQILRTDDQQPKSLVAAQFWSIMVTFIVLATYINLISLPCKERQSGTRHIHIMCGCPSELYWSATLLAHTAISAVFLFLPVLIAVLTLDKDNTFNNADFIGATSLFLLMASLSFFASMYLLSFLFGERNANIVLIASIIVFGMITTFLKIAADTFVDENERSALTHFFLVACLYLAPPYTSVKAATRIASVARVNAFCDLNRDRCPNIGQFDVAFDKEKCCAGQSAARYLCFNEGAPGTEIAILFFQFVIYMIMVILSQRGVFLYIWDRVLNTSYRALLQTDASVNVRGEKQYVESAINLPRKQIPDSMLVNNVHKRYFRLFQKSCNAVQGINFSVKKGECFGLLGVNGAGKSTTFKMLTAEQCTTRGNIFANTHRLGACGNAKYLQTLGYCPQFFGLDDFLTGNDNLALLLTLRGYKPEDVQSQVRSWIKVVGLEKYAKQPISEYSGGCVRRLGAAAALCVGAQLSLLDEPTAGVDVSARRRVWAALRRGLRNKRSVIITSHSMDEMEALCSRIAIMSGGQIKALGSAAELRAQHAAGHAVIFKLRHTTSADEVDGPKSNVMHLKSKLHELFNCTLKDEHKTMLHYHIDDSLRYSALFKQLEALKHTFPGLIEDYSVTETTLEEVFLSYATKTQVPMHV